MQELTMSELKEVNGGYRMYSGWLVLEGFGLGIAGSALAVAGLGTPISIAGAALAFEGAAAIGVGLVDTGG